MFTVVNYHKPKFQHLQINNYHNNLETMGKKRQFIRFSKFFFLQNKNKSKSKFESIYGLANTLTSLAVNSRECIYTSSMAP